MEVDYEQLGYESVDEFVTQIFRLDGVLKDIDESTGSAELKLQLLAKELEYLDDREKALFIYVLYVNFFSNGERGEENVLFAKV